MQLRKWFSEDFRIEKLVFGVYILFLFFAVVTHEPWFDEMQAWTIAKTASWKDLFLLIPHYEGHPPFFHLLLALPARLGVPWEIGLRLVCVGCSIASAYLIIFKAPFSRWIRCAIPFTFFLFYQYGVIARPYNILVLVLILAAIYFPKKNENPLPFTIFLGLLCAFHLFGLAIAGGIAVAWLWEMKGDKSWQEFFRSLLSDKRFYCLLVLLGWAILMLVVISPASDAWALTFQRVMPVWKQALYLLFGLPADAVLTDVYDEIYAVHTLSIPTHTILNASVVGALMWGIIFSVLSRKYWSYLMLPYVFCIGLMSFYCARHHIGMCVLIALFVFWIFFAGKNHAPAPHPFIKGTGKTLLSLILIVSILWTVGSVYHDTVRSVFPGKEIIAFLEEHQLENSRIMSSWLSSPKKKDGTYAKPDQVNVVAFGTELSFYAGRNLLVNFNAGTSKMYRIHQYSDQAQQDMYFAQWREGGLPDVLIGQANLDKLFDKEDLLDAYVPVFRMSMYDIWKMFVPHRYLDNIYVRSDLLKTHGLLGHHYRLVPVLTKGKKEKTSFI